MSYAATCSAGGPEPVSVPDDGSVRAGAALSYRDNGDGTIADLTTGLVWEKKCAGCEGLHAVEETYRWSGDGRVPTIWDWLDRVNSEGDEGFAGHSDWRIPNVTELVSLVDYGAEPCTVSGEFRAGSCAGTCSELPQAGCSCTALGEYWTSTTFADFPAHALAVSFTSGFAQDRVKSVPYHVRAVRGGRRE